MYRLVKPGQTVITLTMALALIITAALPSWGGFKPRRNSRRPYNRQAAATRGGCGANSQVPLTALVPLGNLGLTTAARPTFHWYMPENNTYRAVQFVLYEVTQVSPVEEKEVYSARFPISRKAGLVSLDLPNHSLVPELKVGHEYHWQVKLICDLDDFDPSGNQVANGWIQRVPLETQLAAKLEQVQAPEAKFELLAESGLWYDALKQLQVIQGSTPESRILTKKWRSILDSVYVQLDHIPHQSLANR